MLLSKRYQEYLSIKEKVDKERFMTLKERALLSCKDHLRVVTERYQKGAGTTEKFERNKRAKEVAEFVLKAVESYEG